MRQCSNCSSKHSQLHKNGYEIWYRIDKDKNDNWFYFCSRCYGLLIRRPKRFETREEFLKWASESRKGLEPPNKGIHKDFKRKCSECSSKQTEIDKKGCARWPHDKEGNYYCMKCWRKLFVDYKEQYQKYKETHKRRFWFMDHDERTKDIPRKGICERCGTTGKRTHIHHEQYDPKNPLAHTVELCNSCHAKRSFELGQLTGLGK